MAVASLVARRASARFGRVPTIIATKVVGISLLFAMWAFGLGYDEKGGEISPLWANAAIIVPASAQARARARAHVRQRDAE